MFHAAIAEVAARPSSLFLRLALPSERIRLMSDPDFFGGAHGEVARRVGHHVDAEIYPRLRGLVNATRAFEYWLSKPTIVYDMLHGASYDYGDEFVVAAGVRRGAVTNEDLRVMVDMILVDPVVREAHADVDIAWKEQSRLWRRLKRESLRKHTAKRARAQAVEAAVLPVLSFSEKTAPSSSSAEEL